MEVMEKLSAHLGRRPVELRKLKEEGRKIIGYVPNGYMPEELLYACGAVPVGLIRGGEPEPVAVSGAYIPRFLDTFCRSQIGYKMLAEEFLYQIVDLIVVPVTDNNVRAIAESWDFFTDTKSFRYGVPHVKDKLGFEYFLGSLNELKEEMERFTGNKVDEDKLREYITLFDRMRELLKEITLLRKSERPPISGGDFARLNHASMYADPSTFVDMLESLSQELKEKEVPVKKPRILLTGSTLAMGDYKIPDMVQDLGAAVVVEEFSEGIRPYWEKVGVEGDLLKAWAETCFMKRIAPAFFRPSSERVDFLLKLAEDFNVDGIIWYQLMYRDSYDVESFYFDKALKEKLGIPMLKVQSDYDKAELGPLRTRVETFIETLRR